MNEALSIILCMLGCILLIVLIVLVIKLMFTLRKIDKVIKFNLDDRVVLERISGRLTCSECGSSYHKIFNPPKQDNICDVCEAKLIVRKDDNIESAKVRLTNYYALTYPIIDYYKEQNKLACVDGFQDIERVTKDIIDILKGE